MSPKDENTPTVSVFDAPVCINIGPTDIINFLSANGSLAVHIDQPFGSSGSSGYRYLTVSSDKGLNPSPPYVMGTPDVHIPRNRL